MRVCATFRIIRLSPWKTTMRLLFVLMVIFLFCSCEKNQVEPGEKVEIYLLKNNPMVVGKCQVNSSIAVLDDTAIVKNDDVIAYSKSSYQFTLTGIAYERIKKIRNGAPFAVVLDTQVVYYGIAMSSFSSSSCSESITMDYVGSGNQITMSLGYPGTNVHIDDQRNNSKLLATLKYQKKLK